MDVDEEEEEDDGRTAAIFLPRSSLVWRATNTNEKNTRLRNKVRCACLDDALPYENIGHGWFKTRDGIRSVTT